MKRDYNMLKTITITPKAECVCCGKAITANWNYCPYCAATIPEYVKKFLNDCKDSLHINAEEFDRDYVHDDVADNSQKKRRPKIMFEF